MLRTVLMGLGVGLGAAVGVGESLGPPEVVLEYVARYLCQANEPDHLLAALDLGGGRVVVAGNRGLALVDLASLPASGSRNALFRLGNLNARNVYRFGSERILVNLNRGETQSSPGFAVVLVDGPRLVLERVVDEPDTLYEKMCVVGSTLYVAAHARGLRIYSLANPGGPVLLGRLESGFVDAFSVAVEGSTAYVADGAGGLKVVDVSDPDQPVLLGGEDLATAVGTAEDVTVRGGHVFVAAGGAGLACYPGGNLARRVLVPVGACAEDLAWVGPYLAVATMDGVTLLAVGPEGVARPVGRETTARRDNGTLRLCEGVAGTADGLLLAADWNFVDVYRPVSGGAASQPDIESTVQRVRFPPSGGTQRVTLTNHGAAPLVIASVTSSAAGFSADFGGGTLLPGESVSFTVAYDGSPQPGSGVIRIGSNDPDENPLPIQVFGRTEYLDPGEPVPDFTLPGLRRDPFTGGLVATTFRLSEQRGKVVWFQVYGYW
ncbi:MAG: hypothetical protein HXY19_00890 [Thermoanaerobaculaceae bacterium]|nr:hypothetical protein [Thermoanaerobaculaceae bacterium]